MKKIVPIPHSLAVSAGLATLILALSSGCSALPTPAPSGAPVAAWAPSEMRGANPGSNQGTTQGTTQGVALRQVSGPQRYHGRREDYVMHTNLSAGYRSADSETRLGGVDSPSVGLEVDWYLPEAWFGYEAGGTTDLDEDSHAWEGYVGLRKTWHWAEGLTPYAGAGVSYISVDPDLLTLSNVRSWGGYAHVGVYWPLPIGSRILRMPMTIGFDLRTLVGDDYDYVEGKVFLGFGRP